MRRLLCATGIFLTVHAAWGQPSVNVHVNIHNTGTGYINAISAGDGTHYSTPHLSTIGGVPANSVVNFEVDYDIGTYGNTWFANDVVTITMQPCSGVGTMSQSFNSGPAGGTFDVYFSCTGGSGPPAPTNSLFCATFNNTSGTAQLFALADPATGAAYSLDPCGDNEVFVSAGQTMNVCLTLATTTQVQVVQVTTPCSGVALVCGGFLSGSYYDPNMDGNLSGVNLTGTPIPAGSPPSSVSNTNIAPVGFGASGTVYTNGNYSSNSPIAFTATPSGLASNATLVAGFDAVFAELVNVANTVGKADADTKGALAPIASSTAATATGVTSLGGQLSTINGSVGAGNTTLSIISSAMGTADTDLAQIVGELNGLGSGVSAVSNLNFQGDGSLAGISNGVFQIVSNTAGMSPSLIEMSNYASSALAGTNAAYGGLSATWSDGVNIATLTNAAAYYAEVPLADIKAPGVVAEGIAESVGTGAMGGEDASFWTLNLSVGNQTYSFDCNPMDNAGVAALAGGARACEEWILCLVYVLMTMKIFDQYVGTMGGASQLQLNKTSVLGNSVGDLSLVAYLPVMIAVVTAIPVLIGAAIASGIGATWFAAFNALPLASAGYGGIWTQSIWLVDQFFPINFCIASALWYVFIRLTAAPVWATALVVFKTLVA